MKLKSLLFGSAAVLAAGTGAQAADLPTVEPVEYVRICDAFGTGFYYIPGTDTCLRIGGYVRVESHVVNGFDPEDLAFRFGIQPSEFNNYTTRSRGHINLDARTQTDFGLVRAFIAYDMTVGTINSGDAYPSDEGLDAAYIQVSNDWGTYTAGRTGSFFDFFGSTGWGTRLLIDDPTGNVTTFGWTFAGGNGFSFTIAAQDSLSAGTGSRDAAFGGLLDDYEGQEFPDGVANIRVDQGWGSAQVMAAVHPIHDLDGFADSGASDTELGFAVGAGLSIGIPGGWKFSGQGTYADGALHYATNDPGGFFAGVIPLNAGDFTGPDASDTSQAWNIRAAVEGPLFNPNINVWLEGSYTDVDNGLPVIGQFFDYTFAAIQVGAAWTPVPGLTMGPEFAWNSIEYDNGAIDALTGSDVWGAMWRIQRSF